MYGSLTLQKDCLILSFYLLNDPVIKEMPLACADEKAAVEFMERKDGATGHPAPLAVA
jgi:hypothetical protein